MGAVRSARRADVGKVRLNRRDLRAIEWIFDMGAIFEIDMSVLLSPTTPISVSAVRSVVRRWEKLGVAQAEPVLARQGRLVRLTVDGVFFVSGVEEHAQVVNQQGAAFVHQALMSRVRLRIERTATAAGPVHGWTSERLWRLENAADVTADAHVPHGLIRLADGDQGAVYLAHTAGELNRFQLRLAAICRRHPFVIVAGRAELFSREMTTALGDLAAQAGGRLSFVGL